MCVYLFCIPCLVLSLYRSSSGFNLHTPFNLDKSLDIFLTAVYYLISLSVIINKLTCFLHFRLCSDLWVVYIFCIFLLLNNTFTAMSGLFFSNLSIFLIDTGNSSFFQLYFFFYKASAS